MSDLPEALLLDLDDTLIGGSVSARELWDRLCAEFAPRLGGVDAAALIDAVTEARTWFWSDLERHRTGRLDLTASRRRIVADARRRLGLPEDDDELAAAGDALADAFTEQREELTEVLPGALEMLRAVRERGVPLGLLTNGSREFQRRKLERFDLEDFFEVVVVEGEFGVGKPDPRVFHHALEALGVAPEGAWMVGDDLARDMAPARALGITAIWVDGGGGGLPGDAPVQPDRVVRSVRELV